jgi:hypothetical protein
MADVRYVGMNVKRLLKENNFTSDVPIFGNIQGQRLCPILKRDIWKVQFCAEDVEKYKLQDEDLSEDEVMFFPSELSYHHINYLEGLLL